MNEMVKVRIRDKIAPTRSTVEWKKDLKGKIMEQRSAMRYNSNLKRSSSTNQKGLLDYVPSS